MPLFDHAMRDMAGPSFLSSAFSLSENTLRSHGSRSLGVGGGDYFGVRDKSLVAIL